ncbi:MAG: GntR family transcriptional regulator [Polyangiaceae bacterium]
MINPTGEVKRVAQIVLARIFDGTYPQGLRLPSETALAEELTCGRSTIREALRYLADLGLIRSRRGSGAMVLDFRREGTPSLLPTYLQVGKLDSDPHMVARELLDLRSMMAAKAVRLAARYATEDDLAEARACLDRAPSLEHDPAAHALNELDFYRALVVASRIWPAVWMVNAFWAPLRELNAVLAPLLGRVRPDLQDTLIALMAHVESGDEEGAVEIVETWFAKVDRDIESLLGAAMAASMQSS